MKTILRIVGVVLVMAAVVLGYGAWAGFISLEHFWVKLLYVLVFGAIAEIIVWVLILGSTRSGSWMRWDAVTKQYVFGGDQKQRVADQGNSQQ